MQRIERTTQKSPRPEPASSPPSPQESEDTETRVTISRQTKEVHIYTYPGPVEHYENSDLSRDIKGNPALYWGNAKF